MGLSLTFRESDVLGRRQPQARVVPSLGFLGNLAELRDGQGNYSLWAIPRADRWTIIFNKAADVYHTSCPGEAQDVLRLDVSAEQGPHVEALTFYFPVVEGKDAVLRLHWGEVMIPLSIRVP